MDRLLTWWKERPALWRLTAIALAVRLLAAIFSQGYFAHDDHFLVVEAAQSWVDGFDYNRWLPWNQGPDAEPSGHSFVYVGVHFLLFELLDALGLTDPKAKMLVVRILHALWSLVVVRVGYRMALRMGSERTAWTVGLLLALFCFMPFLSVRQLVEMTCVPFLMLGAARLFRLERSLVHTDAAVRLQQQHNTYNALLAGLYLGLAVNVRFQTLFFAAGPGLVLLAVNRRAIVPYLIGFLLPLVVFQAGIDLFIWGRPFAELGEYVRYNFANATTYGKLPWYNYLLLLAAIHLPPLSLAVFFGFFRGWRRQLLMWSGVFLFLAAHSWFPNKQERFIFPIVPLFFVIGCTEWERFRAGSAFWQRRPAWWDRCMAVTWALHLALLLPITLTYSKRSRCEALYALRSAPWARGVVVEDSREHEPPQLPLFYWGKWDASLSYVPDTTFDLRTDLDHYDPAHRPNVVFFIGDEDLPQRMAWVHRHAGPLQPMWVAEPGLVDRAVHWLNPVNRNERIHGYRILNEPSPVAWR